MTPEYEVVSDLSNYPQYSDLFIADNHFTPSQEDKLLAALQEGKIFLELSGATALYVLHKVPGAIKYTINEQI